jgi:fluoroquinolone transport system permease protein
MKLLSSAKVFTAIDAKTIRRDSMLGWMVFLPLVYAIACRQIIPTLLGGIEKLIKVDLLSYYQPIMSYCFIMLVPCLVGYLIGFLLLDQRDDLSLLGLQVTPISLNQYLSYRIYLPGLLSIAFTMLLYPLANLIPLTFPQLLGCALMAAPSAPFFALFFASFAQNKVQGLVLMKGSGIFLLLPVIAYFIPNSWQYAFGIVPTYWPAKYFWSLLSPDNYSLLYGVIGLIYQSFLVWLLTRFFNKILHR